MPRATGSRTRSPRTSLSLGTCSSTANSVSVGFAEITTVSRAVVVLGLKQLRACLLHALLEQEFEGGTDELHDQLICSFHSAVLAKQLAVKLRHRALTETYMAGMFSDLGTTLTIHYLPEEFALIERLGVREDIGRDEAFRRVLEVSAHDLGVAIGAEWGLPQLMLDTMQPLSLENFDEPTTSGAAIDPTRPAGSGTHLYCPRRRR